MLLLLLPPGAVKEVVVTAAEARGLAWGCISRVASFALAASASWTSGPGHRESRLHHGNLERG